MKQQRDRYQSGSLWEENGKWWLRYSEKHADGKTERPTVCVGTVEQYNTPKKARIAADRIMEKVNDGLVVTRMSQLCDDYEQRGIDHLRGNTQVAYQSPIHILGKEFGNERLDWLATAPGRARMERWLNGKEMCASTRRRLKSILKRIFRHALRMDYLKGTNPIDLIDLHNLPSNTRPKRPRNIITPEQYEALQNDPRLPDLYKVLVSVLVMTGIRGCEAMGLSWGYRKPGDADYRPCDIDLSADPPKIWIRRSVTDRGIKQTGKFMYDPKNLNSKRTVSLPDALIPILKRLRAEYPVFNGWLFGSPKTGRPRHMNAVRRSIKEAAARNGFDYTGFGLHNPRHTMRRALEDNGATIGEQMMVLGHESPQSTHKYGQDGFDQAAKVTPIVNKVVSILSQKKAS
jgi:integrase